MPANLREIKGRIRAVGNIQRITKTMQMIATARFQAMAKRATDAQAYSQRIREVAGQLAEAMGDDAEAGHPLLSSPTPAVGRELLLVIGSDRGLCGAYNANLVRAAATHFRSLSDDTELRLEAAGRKAVGILKFSGRAISQVHEQFGDKPAYADVEALAQRYIDEFVAGKYDAVRVCSTAYVSKSRQVAMVQTLLPLEPPAAQEAAAEASGGASGASGQAAAVYEFQPDPASLLDAILPMTVKTGLFQLFSEAIVSEQLARMVAMKAATDAAGKQRKRLKRDFNRARQTAITTELSEIIGGAAALE
ncbi:MAG: ATP synthase F1 subunit gamma [Planctomycetota bacterium]